MGTNVPGPFLPPTQYFQMELRGESKANGPIRLHMIRRDIRPPPACMAQSLVVWVLLQNKSETKQRSFYIYIFMVRWREFSSHQWMMITIRILQIIFNFLKLIWHSL
mmetsp:Transcript_16095/g.21993  ORF Transcript_16095/g.21993 Transcript_16095/m.21993 type:complete len:107 (-) Transcript_16095:291-611(-)